VKIVSDGTAGTFFARGNSVGNDSRSLFFGEHYARRAEKLHFIAEGEREEELISPQTLR